MSENLTGLNKAMAYALKHHTGQYRKNSGIPYFTHVVEVMKALSRCTLEIHVLTAALLHDIIEDTAETYGDIQLHFGTRVADIVQECSRDGGDDVTKLQKYEFLQSFANKSMDAIILKIADRYCNVNDYIADGSEEYAAVYAAQAYPLFQAYFRSAEENPVNQPALYDMILFMHKHIKEYYPDIDIHNPHKSMQNQMEAIVL